MAKQLDKNFKLTEAGVAGKRPLVRLPYEALSLDASNPRLMSWFGDRLPVDPSQFELLQVLYRRYDARSIAISMAVNGYFDEEPLVVVPVDEGFRQNLSQTLEAGGEAVQLVESYLAGGGTFVAVEGNRRLSAIKLLLDLDARSRVKVPASFPSVASRAIAEDLAILPCVVYPNREDVVPYLGVKHIQGPLRWESYSQAAYTAKIIDGSLATEIDPEDALSLLERQTGTNTTRLKRLYIAYKVFKQLEADIEIDRNAVIERFSFVATMYAQVPLRRFLGLKPPSAILLKERLVTDDYLENAQLLFDWIFGNEATKKKAVVMESRDITTRLVHVVQHPEAVAYLRDHQDLSGAYDRTDGELNFLLKRLQGAVQAAQQVMQVAYRYETKERREERRQLVAKAEELEAAVRSLRRLLPS